MVLFLAQQVGTAKLAVAFSPAAAIWFALLAATGIYNIVSFPGVFRACDPSRAVMCEYSFTSDSVAELTFFRSRFCAHGKLRLVVWSSTSNNGLRSHLCQVSFVYLQHWTVANMFA